jgi:hypothetical protein
MRRLLLLTALLLSLAVTAAAQSGNTAFRILTGPTLPSTCRVGDIFYKTTATAGEYNCTATDVWTLTGGASGGAGNGGGVSGSISYNPPSLLNGQIDTITMTVTGAVVGDSAVFSFTQPLPNGMRFSEPQITAADTATINLINDSGSTQDVAAGTLKISTTGLQNLFSSVVISGQTTVAANTTTTALTLAKGTNFGLSLVTDNTAKSVTFGATTDNLRFANLGLGVAAPTSGGQIASTLGANNITGLLIKRNTDTSPTGKFFDLQNAAGSSLASMDIAGNLTVQGCTGCGAGGGGVTSVAQTFTGGLISVAGSPITTSGTLALTVAGTSGGIPYFSGATTWASSGVLTANLPVIGGGAGVAPTVGTRSGNTTQFVTTTGTLTSGDCVKIDASGNFVANGSACGSGGGGGSPGGSGTELQYRGGASTFSAVTGSSVSGGNVTLAGSLTVQTDGSGIVAGSARFLYYQAGPSLFILGDGGATNSFNFSSVSASPILFLDTGGSVGIGSSTLPTANGGKVLVFGNNAANPTMGASTVGLWNNGAVLSTSDSFAVRGTTDSTSTTTGSLQVAGGAAIRKRVWMDGLSTSGSGTTYMCIASSGELINDNAACIVSALKFKDNIEPLTNGLDEVMKLRPVAFNYKTGGSRQIGLIAEDVAEVDERLAIRDKNGELHSVDYLKMPALLVRAIQEQQDEIEQLRREIQSLKASRPTLTLMPIR